MSIYVDTGLLCSVYSPDANSTAAIRVLTRARGPVPLIWLHQLELRNALRLRVFRREITGIQRDASLNAFLSDIAVGVYAPTELHPSDVMLEAERLSASHSHHLGTRTLDILHVAAALVLGAREFWSFDQRQSALARAAGLLVK
jgi:predicted nucleic acid-binding protein